uniref:Uncharacterized protein n=1 Tax=Peronospora matthiolae TaxID=2874970 RepID=A0AAV1UUG9_9STRA
MHSSTDESVQVLQREPRVLLSLLQSFPYPEEILQAIDDQFLRAGQPPGDVAVSKHA